MHPLRTFGFCLSVFLTYGAANHYFYGDKLTHHAVVVTLILAGVLLALMPYGAKSNG